MCFYLISSGKNISNFISIYLFVLKKRKHEKKPRTPSFQPKVNVSLCKVEASITNKIREFVFFLGGVIAGVYFSLRRETNSK